MIYFDEAIAARRSVRRFSNRRVAGADIRKILEAGCLAPSAKNAQPWRFLLLSDEKRCTVSACMAKYGRKHPSKGSTVCASAEILAHAPAVIAVFSAVEPTASVYLSIGACLENMSLKATDLGLGSLIVCDGQGIDGISALLEREEALVAFFLIGYEDGTAKPREKLPLEELVSDFDFGEELDTVDDFPEAVLEDEPFLFISYCHRDAQIVKKDIVELKRHGVRLWYDRSIACGEEWDKKALGILTRDNCAGVLVYVSAHAAASQSVCQELTCAREHFKAEEGKIIGIHIGGRALADYLGASAFCDEVFLQVFSSKSKFIPRDSLPARIDAIPEIVHEAERLGAVSESGAYDEFRFRRISGGIEIVQYIGSSKRVEFPASVDGLPVISIGKNAMRANGAVCEIIVPGTVRQIGEGAFFNMENLVFISLPDSIEYLGVAAFRGCVSLTSVQLPKGLKKLEEALFRGCIRLKACDVPASVEEFGEAVFRECESLERVYAPSVKKMTEGGFYGCVSLSFLTLSPDIEGLEEGSFLTCPKVNLDAGGFRFRCGKLGVKMK